MSNAKKYPYIYKYVPRLIESGADGLYLQQLNNQIGDCYNRQADLIINDMDVIIHDMFGVGVIHTSILKNGRRYDTYTDNYAHIKLQLETKLSADDWRGGVSLHNLWTGVSIISGLGKSKTVYAGCVYNTTYAVRLENNTLNYKDKFINYLMTRYIDVSFILAVKREFNKLINIVTQAKLITDSGANYTTIA